MSRDNNKNLQKGTAPASGAVVRHANLRKRLDEIATELNHYAYGKDENGRYPSWEEIAIASSALERAIEQISENA